MALSKRDSVNSDNRGKIRLHRTLYFRLLAAFVVMFTVSALWVLFFALANIRVVQMYDDIADRLILENRFVATVPKLFDAYFEVVNSGAGNRGGVKAYDELKLTILGHIDELDKRIAGTESRAAWRGLRNFVTNIISECDLGVAAVKRGQSSLAWDIYSANIAPMRPFVYENTSLLISQELRVSDNLQAEVNLTEKRLHAVSLAIFVIVGLVNVILLLYVARSMTDPMRRLSKNARQIAGGDLEQTVPPDLLERDDEIGNMSRSLDSMLARLKREIISQKKASDELEASRVEFISIATHQLKTPVTGLRWNLEMLSEGKTKRSSKELEIINDTKKIIGVLSNLVNSLLNVSRIELGNYAVIPEPMSPVDELREVVSMVKPEAEGRGLSLSVDISDTVPKSYDADRQMLGIIYQNIISNAVKYTPDGGTVLVKLGWGQGGLLFEVKDSGVGIPAEQQDKIFTKMFRAANVSGFEGTGLGLFSVKKIVESVSGSVTFVSEVGKGTTFTVVLPRDGMPAKAGTRRLS